MFRIRKGDTVEVTRGKDSGKKGKVLMVFPREKRCLVEGLNLLKKHKRQTRQDQQAGIVSLEMPLSLSNLSLVCKRCNRPVRVGFIFLKDGSKQRICRVCKEAL